VVPSHAVLTESFTLPRHYPVFAGQLLPGVRWSAAWNLLRSSASSHSKQHDFQEHDMPNRRELAIPARPADFGARDAWMVISFCAIGWLMSVGLAASRLGALPALHW
jgi:hypothetical protein